MRVLLVAAVALTMPGSFLFAASTAVGLIFSLANERFIGSLQTSQLSLSSPYPILKLPHGNEHSRGDAFAFPVVGRNHRFQVARAERSADAIEPLFRGADDVMTVAAFQFQ